MFSKPFLAKTGEQAVVAFLGGFGSVLAAGTDLTKAFVVGGLVAGARAAYGVLVRNVGAQDTPSVK